MPRSAFASYLAGLACLIFACTAMLSAREKNDGKDEAEAPAPSKLPDLSLNADKPITADHGEIGKLLTQWWKEGTAAGNVGDRYDNRDRTHSMLNMKPYPQLTLVPYTDAERKKNLDWAAQGRLLQGVVFGNSSTSAPATGGGSNIRRYYVNPRGMLFLYTQYRGSNLYMYPEHRDHDFGHNGHGDGYGDLYPVNSPYLIASQGSSGSDQPFMKAVPFALAAFRPDVKKELAAKGLLMPTVQMIFRRTNNHIASDEEYLSGKAHPTVFEGKWVDALAMVKMAHEITLETAPPLVLLKVLEETKARQFADYVDPHPNEHLSDTPCMIGRVFRGHERTRRMKVSAAASVDLNNKSLTYRWVLLRGDPKLVGIKPNAAGTEAEIEVAYHTRRPSAGPGSIASNRVDIGVFAHNGTYWSPPSFITFFSLDHEARGYGDDGRVLDIGHQNGEVRVSVKDWDKFFSCLKDDAAQPFAASLREKFTPAQREAMLAHAPGRAPLAEKLDAAKKACKGLEDQRNAARKAEREAQKAKDEAAKAHKDKAGDETKAALDKATAAAQAAVEARKKTDGPANEAKKAMEEAQKALDRYFDDPIDKIRSSVNHVVAKALAAWVADPDLYTKDRKRIDEYLAKNAKAKGHFDEARKDLVTYGLLADDAKNRTWTPVREGDGPLADRLTPAEQVLVERANRVLLAEVMFGAELESRFGINYVDPLLSLRKPWRDVYRHNAKGEVIGWTRYAPQGKADFHADGWIIVEKDARGRAAKTQAVDYDQAPNANKRPYPNFNPVTWKTKPGHRTYAYTGDDDFIGIATEVKPEAPAEKKEDKAGEVNEKKEEGAEKN